MGLDADILKCDCTRPMRSVPGIPCGLNFCVNDWPENPRILLRTGLIGELSKCTSLVKFLLS